MKCASKLGTIAANRETPTGRSIAVILPDFILLFFADLIKNVLDFTRTIAPHVPQSLHPSSQVQTMMDIHALREDYTQAELRKADLHPDPFKQFEAWFQQACQAELQEPNAMILATASATGAPLARTVLLKYFDLNGFVFFTNYESRKAGQIRENPQVSLLFLWLPLQRQVQITGTAEKVSTAESLNYFATRPRGSQLGAWSSQQSSVISSRQLLLTQLEHMKQKFLSQAVPLPAFWGGYRVKPTSFEFWQGRPNRLHDRFLYTPDEQHSAESPSWQVQRLAP